MNRSEHPRGHDRRRLHPSGDGINVRTATRQLFFDVLV